MTLLTTVFRHRGTRLLCLLLLLIVCGESCRRGEQNTASIPSQGAQNSQRGTGGVGGASAVSPFSTTANLELELISSADGLPCDEVKVVHQDREGFIWIGSRHGLFKYDGFQFSSIRNYSTRSHALTSNDICCLNDDAAYVWVGTSDGINRIDKRTGHIGHYPLTDTENCRVTDCILITREGEVWVGTDGGLYIYDAEQDRFVFHSNGTNGCIIPYCSVKSLCEDEQDYIWIGTWDQGVYRYHKATQTWYHLPDFNERHSAQVVHADHRGGLWVGTWGDGVYRIDNPYATFQPLACTKLPTASPNASPMGEGLEGTLHFGDIIFSLADDPSTSSLWVGSRGGLTIYDTEHPLETPPVVFPAQRDSTHRYMSRGITSIVRGQSHQMWMATIGQGVIKASTIPNPLTSYDLHTLFPDLPNMDKITCLYPGDRGELYVGLDLQGIRVVDSLGRTQDVTHALTGRSVVGTVNAIVRRRSGDILVGTTYDGLFVRSGQSVTHYQAHQTPWMNGQGCVFAFCEEDDGSLLLGTDTGLCMLLPNGQGVSLNEECGPLVAGSRVLHITRNGDDHWLSTQGEGLLRLHGRLHPGGRPAVTHLNSALTPHGDTLNIATVGPVVIDDKQRLWTCAEDVGLLLYDEARGCLTNVNDRFGLTDIDIKCIETDSHGNLWLSTNVGIRQLQISDHADLLLSHVYTTHDGLPTNYFGDGASCRLSDGTLCFSSIGSITRTLPQPLSSLPNEEGNESPNVEGAEGAPLITDIKVLGRSLYETGSENVADQLPPFTRSVTLPPPSNFITFEFSTLTYGNALSTSFFYMLEGYEQHWTPTRPGEHAAHYKNLPPGNYRFLLRSLDANGQWSPISTTTLHVLTPLWLRPWALLLYALLLIGVAVLVYRYFRRREWARRQRLRMELEREQTDELNHKKLQLFTNITHDMMTPLTVIAATVEKIKGDHYTAQPHDLKVVTDNLNRQTRMLQQILAFRKSETGNLRLCVSRGRLADFCRSEVESIQPLIRGRGLTLTFSTDLDNRECYFDRDLIDHVLYNLLSNAAKYNRSGGTIHLSLLQADDPDFVRIAVTDNGVGISKERQRTLFQRFYEGEHRRFNTYGTGIGLSLTKDYVTLCHGTIDVESKPGEGTTFTILLPVTLDHFKEEEVDTSLQLSTEDTPKNHPSKQDASLMGESMDAITPSTATILIVEDNEDLLGLIRQLLQTNYHIVCAHNGQEALQLVQSEPEVDLVVSDVMMPVMDGLELTRRIKNNIETSHIPVLLLTARRTDDDRMEGYDVGADAYLTKPFTQPLLHSRIRNLLQQRRAIAERFRRSLVIDLGESVSNDIDRQFLNQCMQSMNRHLADADFDHGQMAAEVGMSRSALFKKLKALTGMGFSAFVRHVRLTAACKMMDEGRYQRVADVAYAVGFNDPRYFSTCFRQAYGVSPTEYMEKPTSPTT